MTKKDIDELGQHGGDRKSEGYKDQVANSHLVSSGHSSTSRVRMLARLKRDAPEILDRVDADEFPSVRQAAIAAGIVKVPSRVEKMVSLWRNASSAEKEEFLFLYCGSAR